MWIFFLLFLDFVLFWLIWSAARSLATISRVFLMASAWSLHLANQNGKMLQGFVLQSKTEKRFKVLDRGNHFIDFVLRKVPGYALR